MLTVEGLQTSYGQSQVLFGVDLEVRRGEVVTLLGRNGMGKTTTIRSIMELFKMMTKTDITQVSYRGTAPAMTDIAAGVVDVM